MERPQANLEEYNTHLQYTLSSKLFFLPHIPVKEISVVTDFGCANAALLKLLDKVMPRARLHGVDNDPKQRAAALDNFPGLDAVWAELPSRLHTWEGTSSLLILTSVLHEVASFGHSLTDFWNEVEARDYDYIAIRDFSVPAWSRAHRVPRMWSQPICEQSIEDPVLYDQMFSFDRVWGPLGNLYNFMHFLLKRPYAQNWAREMQENCLFADQTELIETLTASKKYRVKHLRFTTPKKFRELTERDLGFIPDVSTHAEIVLVRVP